MNKIKSNPAIVSVHDPSFVTNDEDGEWIDWTETEFISTDLQTCKHLQISKHGKLHYYPDNEI